MSAPTAPANFVSESEEGEIMAAANSTLKIPSHYDESKNALNRLYEGFLMVVQKTVTPSVTISPAVIGLVITMVLQTIAGSWWAASLSKDSANAAKEIESLKSENSTMKVYIDNLRERQIKMEAVQDNLVREQQVLNLMLQQKGMK